MAAPKATPRIRVVEPFVPEPHTPARAVRIADDAWAALEAKVGERGKGGVIRRLIHLYLHDGPTERKVARTPDPVGDRNPTTFYN